MLYGKNFKAQMREIIELNKWRDNVLMDQESQYSKNVNSQIYP